MNRPRPTRKVLGFNEKMEPVWWIEYDHHVWRWYKIEDCPY
jgi:hypothetical protein